MPIISHPEKDGHQGESGILISMHYVHSKYGLTLARLASYSYSFHAIGAWYIGAGGGGGGGGGWGGGEMWRDRGEGDLINILGGGMGDVEGQGGG